MNNVINIINQGNCTGCSACKEICPKDAIYMIYNKDGFLNPRIDNEKCVNCGICINHCPSFKPYYLNNKSPKCYAVWADDGIRAVSSSGGFFSVIACYFLEKNGYVCGAVYNDDFSVMHILTNRKENIKKMRGSKYIQSNVSGIYKEIKVQLSKGEKVLFTGMPCQIAGLYSNLGTEYSNLYTVELVCHGITSYKVFEYYKKDVLKNKEIKALEFKKKTPWGWHAGINAEFSDGSDYRKPAEEDAYFQAYLNGISKNVSCGKCKFNRFPRQADLSMGDFWKVTDFDKSLNDNRGTSLVLINNEHGEELFNAVKSMLKLYREVPLKYAVKGNSSLAAPYKNHFRRNKFFRELNNISFNKLVSHCKANIFDVGIVGLWYGLNYGSILTYYALYCVVNQLGYDAIMVNKPDFIWRPLYDSPDTIAHKFISKHCNVSSLHKYEEFSILNNHCDTFIVGSDVVWNYEICGREAGNFFYLDFAADNKKKIAYGASFGGGYNAPETERYMNQRYLQRFDGVSVREDPAVNICREKFGVNAEKVLDPVFLCDFDKFDIIADEVKINMDKPYIMTYILGGNEQQRDIILQISKAIGVNSLINIVNPNNPQRVINSLRLEAAKQPSVEEWLYYMKHAEFFIGDSFHGLCFAIIFRKQFLIAISKNMPSKDRFLTLLNICGLEDRLIYIEDKENKEYLIRRIDYDKVYKRLDIYKKGSIKWLKEKLAENKEDTEVCELRENYSDMYYVAKAAAENCHGRKIITWGENKEFKEILKKYFDLEVPFWVAKNLSLVDNVKVYGFSEIKEKSKEYYLVIPDVEYTEADARLIEEYGYREGCDYIYRKHKPLVIMEGNYINKKYFDIYNNSITGEITGKFKIILRGFNNQIIIGSNVHTASPINVNMNGNALFELGKNCSFGNDFAISYINNESNTNISKIRIRDDCKFSTGKIAIRKGPADKKCITELLINEACTFDLNFQCNLASGKKIIIGKDCMFSYNIVLQGSDGHSIFDVSSGKRINEINDFNNKNDLMVFGEHVWVGRNSMVLYGTNIGEGSIIGAGSVVKGRFFNNCTVAGTPANVIRRNVAWSRDNFAEKIGYAEAKYSRLTREAEPSISGKRVLVIGGTKFMGVKLVDELIKLGNDVTIATRGNRRDNFGKYITRIIVDISDAECVKKALLGKHFDVIFDNLAYCSNYVKNVLSVVRCARYIQLSSVEVYMPTKINLREEDFNPYTIEQKWCSLKEGYQKGKRQAEAAVYQVYPMISAVTVRIPYVVPTDRLMYYCRHVIEQQPMNIDDLSRGFTFVRDLDVGKFLPWIAAQDYSGPINLAGTGFVTIKMILEYIEKKTGKKAVIDTNMADKSPFHEYEEKTFSMSMQKAERLGYVVEDLNDWIWGELDMYIKKALGERK